MSLYNIIKTNRPNISDSSVKTYSSILNGLLKRMKTDDPNVFLQQPEEVLTFLNDMKPSDRKTILSAIIVLLDEKAKDRKSKEDYFTMKSDNEDIIKLYRDVMTNDQSLTKQIEMKQEKTDKQEDNWISYDTIKKYHQNMEKLIKPIMSKNEVTMKDFQNIQDFIILSLLSGVGGVEPRRLMDYTEMKIRNFDEAKDNYIRGTKFVFNVYKTAKQLGRQEINIPRKLYLLLKRFINYNDTDYLLIDNKKNKLTPSQLNKRLNKIFGGKNISVNILRHVYISDNILKDMPKFDKLQIIASNMGHSVAQQILYKKV
jgi:hypothetical protein